ncbi:MAG: mechanosensitive ion channel domain-containing protein [Aminobacteriaceae bacterium]
MKKNDTRPFLLSAALIVIFAFLALASLPPAVHAADPAPQAASGAPAGEEAKPSSPDVVPGAPAEWKPPETAEKVQERIDELQKEMDLLQKQREDLQKEEGLESEMHGKLIVALGGVQNAYARYATAIDNLSRAKSEAAEAAKTEGASLIKDPPPYNLSFYDGIRNQLEGVDQRLKSVLSSIELAEGALKTVPGQIENAEKKVRTIKADLESPEWVGNREKETELKEAEAELEVARLSMVVNRMNMDAHLLRRKYLEARKAALEKDVGLVGENLKFDEEDLNQRVESLGKEITAVRESLAKLQAEREKIRTSLVRSQGQLKSAKDDQQKAQATALVAERDADLKRAQAAIEEQEQKVVQLEEGRKIWQTRYRLVSNEIKSDELWDTRSQVSSRLKDLENMFQVHQRNLASLQADLLAAQKVLSENEKDKTITQRTQRRITSLEKTIQHVNSTVAHAFSLFNSYSRLEEEINSRIDAVRIAAQVTRFSKERVMAFLNMSLWSGEGYNVTVSKLVISLFLFGAAFFLSGWLTRLVGRTVLRRFKMDPTAQIATQKILFYIFMVSFILSALDVAGIPLTAFAFLGGALAIGIGFGAQNFFNNLISGFILMFTKPIRMNDTIEIDGLFASVEEIGSRSTHVKTFDNIDVLVPNSYFLNNNIINWTHTDQKIRQRLNVGVAYGSDVRKVEELLYKAAHDHSRILKTPEPFVIFRDFGASSLDFTLFYWIDMTKASTLKVGSDLRFRIVALFEEHGIVIAFPQLDVHLDAESPLQLTMMRGKNRKPAEAEREQTEA